MAREAEVSLRTQRSDERRRRLVQAARELLNEADGGAFSMSTLAQRAGLSLATPYNLFGSKAAIVNVDFQNAYTRIDEFRTAYETDPRQIDHVNTLSRLARTRRMPVVWTPWGNRPFPVSGVRGESSRVRADSAIACAGCPASLRSAPVVRRLSLSRHRRGGQGVVALFSRF